METLKKVSMFFVFILFVILVIEQNNLVRRIDKELGSITKILVDQDIRLKELEAK